ncbi:hypothetical protein AB0K35_27670 [Micromonospora sp. NPDC053740]|uniref:hypothetical protein n=1 Tax=Micromonospora sp. NPDC053740 TaxID=3155173 RepID=UPI0034250243
MAVEAPDSGNKPDPVALLARAVRNRRIVLGFSQRQIAARGHLAPRTVVKVENAYPETLRARTTAALERALQWDAGSIQRVLDGGTPVELWTPPAAGNPEVAVVLEAGLPTNAEDLLVAHMTARRADMEAALEGEARMLIEQVRKVRRIVRWDAGADS